MIVLDPSIAKIVDTTDGIKEGGKYIINSGSEIDEIKKKLVGVSSHTLDATRISLDVLGNTRALNTIMLGALIRIAKLVSMDSVLDSLRERFTGTILDKNLILIKKGYDEVNE